jgi:hypothetical protein
MMATATYTTREGERWKLTELRAHAFLPGFWWARREDTKGFVCVHAHRMVFHETPEPEPATAETSNPS